MSTLDRRRSPRKPVMLMVQHQLEGEAPSDLDYATDLSETGVYLRVNQAPSPGTQLRVSFCPAKDARLVSGVCRVARTDASGFGAEFVQLEPGAQELLARALRA
jgi:hypothetical protein